MFGSLDVGLNLTDGGQGCTGPHRLGLGGVWTHRHEVKGEQGHIDWGQGGTGLHRCGIEGCRGPQVRV